MGIRDRLRRLEERFRDRGPSPEEVNIAFEQLADSARARLRGESIDEERRKVDRETIERWKKATGTGLEAEAERTRQKLQDMGKVLHSLD